MRIPGFIMIPSYLLLIIFLNVISCGNSSDKRISVPDTISIDAIGYDLNNPVETIILPPVLHEISGITLIDSTSVACIQDENGIVFIYDLERKEIRKYFTFHGNGDYEDITYANEKIYVLRSDAVLFEINDFNDSDITEEIKLKKIPHDEFEGLCYDRLNRRLLIAPKDKADKDAEVETKRGIYGFNLTRKHLIEKPVMNFKLSSIKKFASEDKNFNKENDGKPDIKFEPSAIGIHPVSGDLFVLSAEDQLMFVFDMKGNIKNIFKLDPYLFNMPEGITFFENGDMLISNEGDNLRPTLLRFSYVNKR